MATTYRRSRDSRSTYPTKTTKPEPTGRCECPLGYAPASTAGPCFYCNHAVRAECHLDYGTDEYGRRIFASRPGGPGPQLAWPIRYADQTVLPRPGYWVDLPEVRKHLVTALEPQRPLSQVRQAIEDVVRLLPER